MANKIIPYTGSALVKTDGKWLSSTRGRYNSQATVDYILINPDRLVTPTDLALMQYPKAHLTWAERYCRWQMWRAVEEILNQNILVYTGYDLLNHSKILWAKHYKGDKLDEEYFDIFIDKAEQKADVSVDKFKLIRAVYRNTIKALKAK